MTDVTLGMTSKDLSTIFQDFRNLLRTTMEKNLAKHDSARFPFHQGKKIRTAIVHQYQRHVGDIANGHFRCSACDHFLMRVSDLAFYTESGEMKWLFWPSLEDLPENSLFRPFIEALSIHRNYAKVTVPFTHKDSSGVVGVGPTYSEKHHTTFEHFQLDLSGIGLESKSELVKFSSNFRHWVIDKRKGYLEEDLFGLVATAFAEEPVVNLRNLQLEKLEKVKNFVGKKDQEARTLLASNNYYRINGTVLGVVFDEVQKGKSVSKAIEIYNSRSDSDVYQRTVRETNAGEAQRHLEAIRELGFESALRRKFATMDEVQDLVLWTAPEPVEEETNPLDKLVASKSEGEVGDKVHCLSQKTVKIKEFVDYLKSLDVVEVSIRVLTPSFITSNVVEDAKPIINGGGHLGFGVTVRGGIIDPTAVKSIVSLPTEMIPGTDDFAGFIMVMEFGDDVVDFVSATGSALIPQILDPSLYPYRRLIEEFNNATPMEIEPDKMPVIGTVIQYSSLAEGDKHPLKPTVVYKEGGKTYTREIVLINID